MHQSSHISTYTPERNAQDEVIGPQGGASACIYYATDNRGERWVIKGHPRYRRNPVFSNPKEYQEKKQQGSKELYFLFDELATWQSALKEVVGNRLYH